MIRVWQQGVVVGSHLVRLRQMMCSWSGIERPRMLFCDTKKPAQAGLSRMGRLAMVAATPATGIRVREDRVVAPGEHERTPGEDNERDIHDQRLNQAFPSTTQ